MIWKLISEKLQRLVLDERTPQIFQMISKLKRRWWSTWQIIVGTQIQHWENAFKHSLFDTKMGHMSSELRRTSITALMQLTYTATNGLNLNIVVNGYEKYGQGYPLNSTKQITACSSPISPEQFDIMTQALPQAIETMGTNFCITEADRYGSLEYCQLQRSWAICKRQ